MPNKYHQLVSTWVHRLQTGDGQVFPWHLGAWKKSQPILTAANQQSDPLLLFQYLHQVRPLLVTGRWWYRVMFPVRLLGRLLHAFFHILLGPFTGRFYGRITDTFSGFWNFMYQLFWVLILVSFFGLVFYHRTLYDQGTDLGWTYGDALFFAVPVALFLEGVLLILVGEILLLVEYRMSSISPML